MKTKKIFFTLLFLIFTFGCFCQEKIVSVKMSPKSNIYIKTLLFYLPITNKIQHSYKINYDNNTFVSVLTINQEDIFDKPIASEIFCSDILIRIPYISLEKDINRTVIMPVTVRVNKTIVEREVKFKIKQKNNKITIFGAINNVQIKDWANNNKYKKRQLWKMPILLDISYELE